MKTSDLKSFGVTLLAPGDSGFEAGVDLAFDGIRSDFVRQIKDFSVILLSTATKTVIGHSVTWEYWSPAGKVFTRGVIRDELSALLDPGHPARVRNRPGNSGTIEPGGALLVSVFASIGRSEPAALRYWRPEVLDDLTLMPRGATEVRAILDGIMFDDGTFAGPNQNGLFEKIVGGFDAVQNVYGLIVELAQDGDLERNLIAWARSLCSDPIVDLEESKVDHALETFGDPYLAASNFVKLYDSGGLEAAAAFARSELYRQRPQFTRIGS